MKHRVLKDSLIQNCHSPVNPATLFPFSPSPHPSHTGHNSLYLLVYPPSPSPDKWAGVDSSPGQMSRYLCVFLHPLVSFTKGVIKKKKKNLLICTLSSLHTWDLRCSTTCRILVSQKGVESFCIARILNHWTTRKVPRKCVVLLPLSKFNFSKSSEFGTRRLLTTLSECCFV